MAIDKEQTNMSTEEYQKMLGSESYKALLQADIQAENAKSSALQNTNMALQNAGLQGSGYGGTLANSNANAYLTALQQNLGNFNTNIGEESTKNMNSVLSSLSSAGTKDDLLAKGKDLGIIDDNNQLNFDSYGGYISNEEKKTLVAEYNALLRDFETGEAKAGTVNSQEATGEEIKDAISSKTPISNTYSNNGKEFNYTTTYVDGKTGWNRDVQITLADGYIMEAKLGDKASRYFPDINTFPKDAKEGQIFYATGGRKNKIDGGESLIIYANGEWRLLNVNGRNRATIKQYQDLLKNFK